MSRLLRWIGPVLLALLILGAVEGGLALADRGAPPADADLRRGFNEDSNLFAEEAPGTWRQLDSTGKPMDTLIPPKDPDTYRVLLFGGSNVRGFPYKALEAHLRRKAPETTWEVFNLGHNGYGSARVLRLVERALERLDADLVVIYSGHNEFVERGFQMDIEEQWSSDWMTDVAEKAQQLRIVNELVSVMTTTEHDEEKDWSKEEKKFTTLTLDETQHHLSWFEQNLTRATELAKSHDVDIVLCTTVYNHFAMPFSATQDPNITPAEHRQFATHLMAARRLYSDSMNVLLPRSGARRLGPADWRSCPVEVFMKAPIGVLPQPRPLQGPLSQYGMRPPPEACWSDKVRAFYERVVAFHSEEPTPDLEQAAIELQAALAVSPGHPAALFEYGLTRYILDADLAEATELLDQAGDFDRVPRRSSRAINNRVRRVAENTGVRLFDGEGIFRAKVPEGLIGWETMRDQCHLHRGARQALMADLGAYLLNLPDLKRARTDQ